jgi:hypothetical protein
MKKYITGIFVGLAMMTSCADKLELAPENAIYEEQIKELLASSPAAAEKVLQSIANNIPLKINQSVELAGSGDPRVYAYFGLNYNHSVRGNDLVFGDKPIGIFGGNLYNFSEDYTLNDPSSVNRYYWYFSWSAITQANKLLNLLDSATVGDNERLKEYKARALTLRAYAYNYLIENYQDAYLQGGKSKLGIMLYDTYSLSQSQKARAGSEETYAFIKNDINTAVRLFTEAAVGYTADVRDFDLGVANFILARVSLCTGDYGTVISACDKILANYPNLISPANYGGKNTGTTVSAEGDLVLEFHPTTNAFLNHAVNPEVIYGFPKGVANTYGNLWLNIFSRTYGGQLEGYARIDNRLYDQIAVDDCRKDAFQGPTALGNYTYPVTPVKNTIPSYVNLKFASTHALDELGEPGRTNVGQTDCSYMRTSEVLLMKAEAQAQTDEAGAKATLNILLAARTKPGRPTLTCNNYGMSGTALDMVKLQTRIEMWGEGGLEFFNNKRWNIPVDRVTSSNHVVKITNPVSKMTLQIPTEETLYNPLCEQN